MTLSYRIARLLGFDTEIEKEYTVPRYKYTVEHLNGDVSTQEGHSHHYDGSFLIIHEEEGDVWNKATVYYESMIGPPLWHRGTVVRRLEGVKELSREQIGEDIWTLIVDMADNEIVEQRHAYVEAN